MSDISLPSRSVFRMKPENQPLLISGLFVLIILAVGTAYTLATQGTMPLLTPNYLLLQLQIGACLGR
jgi:ribose transport system permease protein